MKQYESENNGDKKKENTYKHTHVDIRFLKIVDIIIEKNSAAKIKPNSASQIGEMVLGYRAAIPKIKYDPRGVSLSQLEKFAIYFNLDFNYFFRDTKEIYYDPCSLQSQTHIDKRSQITGNNKITNSDRSGNVALRNNKIQSNMGNLRVDHIGKIIQNADKIVNNGSFDDEHKELLSDMLDSIRAESKKLESSIIQSHKDLKKMTDFYEAQLADQIEQNADLKIKLDHAILHEREITKKYIGLIEQKNLK